jgi:hypothetical protein
MRRIIIFIVGVMLVSNYSFAFDDGDFQYWNTESISWKVNRDWKIEFEQEFRFGDNAGNFYYEHSDLGLIYSGFAEWLDLGLNYRQISEKKSGEWKEENRPHINAILKWEFQDLSFSNRSRLAYRNREDADNFWHYRNKLTIGFPWKLTGFDIQPYMADEIFYDFDEDTLNRNRLYTGASLKLLKDLKAEIYYLWQTSKKNDDWSDVNILGTNVKLNF